MIPGPSREVLRVESVTKTFRGKREPLLVLKDVSFTVGTNELVSIIGASGCGKTTLLRIIDGLLPVDLGGIYCEGRKIDGPPPEFAMVFQDLRLLPWKTARQNVEFAMELKHHRGLTRAEKAKAMEYVNAVGLAAFADHYPHQLSGGMQQRVGVARALARTPEVLLLDEPFGALDAQTRLLMQDWFLDLQDRLRFSALLVTHDIDEAVYVSTRCIVLKRLPGEVKAVLDIGLPRPRHKHDVRRDPQFGVYRSELWNLLHRDAEAANQ